MFPYRELLCTPKGLYKKKVVIPEATRFRNEWFCVFLMWATLNVRFFIRIIVTSIFKLFIHVIQRTFLLVVLLIRNQRQNWKRLHKMLTKPLVSYCTWLCLVENIIPPLYVYVTVITHKTLALPSWVKVYFRIVLTNSNKLRSIVIKVKDTGGQ